MDYRATLIKKYREIFAQRKNRPEWAVRKKSNDSEFIHLPIPFVGKNYDKTKLLLYASAENLTYYTEQDKEWNVLENNNIAIDRHRYCFEQFSNRRYLPYLHIAPVEDGSLLIVTNYILMKIKGILFQSPYDLGESISLGNFGKFSINTKTRNQDYANNLSFLRYSIPYIKADLSVLKPEIIIIPVKIYEHKEIKNTIYMIIPNVKVIPIYQINARTINTHIHKKFTEKDINEIKEFYEWQKHLSNGITGKTNKNFLSVYTYIDHILKNV